ncbi:crossover junction endonuclease EME1B [Senna tora]|uniref:Crossover junction endonuclease EME1B n=1 Tax=Senna tora TaxID=362788 RepID=A0A834X808_9FABA|nr:crossover junction endonuclease EME1B [Senna tora]
MSEPIILSDEEDQSAISTPFADHSKRRRTEPDPNRTTVLILDDDPTPQKPSSYSSTPSFVPETPMSAPSNSDVAFVKCTRVSSDFDPHVRASASEPDVTGISRLICLESDNESENPGMENRNDFDTRVSCMDFAGDSRGTSILIGSRSSPEIHTSSANATLTEISGENHFNPTSSLMDSHPVYDHPDKENISMEQEENIEKVKRSKQEKLRKEALKAEAAELKKNEKEKQKWEKGKFALKSVVAEIDAKVVESGSIGGHLLTRFAEKGLTYHITSNPIERSILWSMKVPEHISQPPTERIEISYVLLVYEADKFCDLVTSESLLDHLSSIQSLYPTYTVCYVTNRLMAYVNKRQVTSEYLPSHSILVAREQEKYKNPEHYSCWKRPPVEEVLAKLTTHFSKVHSRQCVDEAELAEHVVGLTCSLASCQFRKKLTRLSVNANGSLIPKDTIDRNLIKKNLWLKALVAIPKVQPRFAVAIWKKYPNMKSLRLGEVCSKRVYRILMAQRGCTRTDDVEDGADFFGR